MKLKYLAVALASASLLSANAQAQTEIQWWHSMAGNLADFVAEFAGHRMPPLDFGLRLRIRGKQAGARQRYR